jgi:DNA-binding protein HU-beta
MEMMVQSAKKAVLPAKKAAAPAAKRATPATEATAPRTKRAITATKAAAPGTKRGAPATKAAAPSAKRATPAIKAASQKKATAEAVPQVTITLRQIAAELAEGHDLPKKQAEAVLADLVELTTEHLKKGDKIRLTGLGILQVKARPARIGRNPATGESIEIAASKKIAFRPSKELKEAV